MRYILCLATRNEYRKTFDTQKWVVSSVMEPSHNTHSALNLFLPRWFYGIYGVLIIFAECSVITTDSYRQQANIPITALIKQIEIFKSLDFDEIKRINAICCLKSRF